MTGWRPPDRTADAVAAYTVAEADRASRPERYRLDTASVVAAASRRNGDTSDFADGWRSGLDHYLSSAREDGRLNALGEHMVVSTTIARLRAGASLNQYLATRPDAFAVPLGPPIVVVGGWRTGTTFLFRLLASDPLLRAPLPAELVAPAALAELADAEREQAIRRGVAAHEFFHSLNPAMRSIHYSGPWLPEECVLGMGTDFRNWGFSSTVRLESYTDWLAGEDLAASYRRYRQLLQVLDRGDGRRWVLKAPAHTAELRHVAATFPGAVIVFLHRDIVETIASGASRFSVFRSTYSDEVDPVDVGRFVTDQTELWLRRAAAFRESELAASVRIVDLDYIDLVANPVAALRGVYRAAGMDPPDDAAGFVRAHDVAHPRDEFGRHRYAPNDFGLEPGELYERFAGL